MTQIQSVTIRGLKSIRALESLELRPINVLVGPNGAGLGELWLANVIGGWP